MDLSLAWFPLFYYGVLFFVASWLHEQEEREEEEE
jgi:hypothetical protein